jgi:hypothetical protein
LLAGYQNQARFATVPEFLPLAPNHRAEGKTPVLFFGHRVGSDNTETILRYLDRFDGSPNRDAFIQ